jgi:hypothetical protein
MNTTVPNDPVSTPPPDKPSTDPGAPPAEPTQDPSPLEPDPDDPTPPGSNPDDGHPSQDPNIVGPQTVTENSP